jgi:hypothetical protein
VERNGSNGLQSRLLSATQYTDHGETLSTLRLFVYRVPNANLCAFMLTVRHCDRRGVGGPHCSSHFSLLVLPCGCGCAFLARSRTSFDYIIFRSLRRLTLPTLVGKNGAGGASGKAIGDCQCGKGRESKPSTHPRYVPGHSCPDPKPVTLVFVHMHFGCACRGREKPKIHTHLASGESLRVSLEAQARHQLRQLP